LRDHMEFEEVNNPEKPDFLPVPQLERGYGVDIDNIIDFLSVDGRMEVYKNMLHAVLAFEKERKRVVICDEPENIIMWIAAIQYAIPLKAALNINFTTYEFDPSLSASQICGVVPNGTRYNSESHRLHFVFDLLQNQCAEFEKDNEFFEFVDTSMSFSYDTMQDFHKFLTAGYSYVEADENLYAAYRLYMLMSDGIDALSLSDINKALDFAGKYASAEETERIVSNLFSQKDAVVRKEKEYFICVVKYILSHIREGANAHSDLVKTMMVDRVLGEFLNADCTEQEYTEFYDTVNSIGSEKGFSIATELMKADNSQKLFAVMKNEIDAWKIAFVVKVVSMYVKDQNVPVDSLVVDAPLGRIYYGIVQSVYSRNAQNGFFLVRRILDEFNWDCRYLVNMALNVEGMLLDIENCDNAVASLWKYFGEVMLKNHREEFGIAYSILGEYKRYEQIYLLYYLAMTNISTIEEANSIFKEHFTDFVAVDNDYAARYADSIFKLYYSKLVAVRTEDSYELKAELFDLICKNKIKVIFAEDMVKELVRKMPYESPSRQDAKILQDAFQYVYNELRKPLSGKHLLMVIGLVLEGVKEESKLPATLDKLERLTFSEKALTDKMTDKDAEAYFEWILSGLCEMCTRSDDMERIYKLYDFSDSAKEVFFTVSARNYLKLSKDEKDYGIFCKYLHLVFREADSSLREKTGKLLSKLNKQKLQELDKDVKNEFGNDKKALVCWNEIKSVAESGSPLFSNFSNLFKRKKD